MGGGGWGARGGGGFFFFFLFSFFPPREKTTGSICFRGSGREGGRQEPLDQDIEQVAAGDGPPGSKAPGHVGDLGRIAGDMGWGGLLPFAEIMFFLPLVVLKGTDFTGNICFSRGRKTKWKAVAQRHVHQSLGTKD